MGLFDFFSKGKASKGEGGGKKVSEREIARMAKLVSTKMSQNYDRQEAIEELGRIGTADSSRALLKRFDWTMEPSITDQEEKEAASRGIRSAGSDAIGPIREYCKKAESLTWPLKTLRDLVPDQGYVEELLGVLDLFDTEYVRNAEPKVQLINLLEEYPSEDVRIAVEPFMTDASEPVRFAAVTTVFAMNDETSVPALVSALAEEESLRVRNRIAQGLLDRDWEVPENLREACTEALPDGYALSGGKVRRG
ncbi:MAG: HEAT repeat domain-containing protein [Myxococcales bacterium]|nr:HEAT repeat domain-containing protein [Myxococcales bacterium]MCB9576704.1 HEAT repeat domain-containing protein [Polyangiaceae bacterium]